MSAVWEVFIRFFILGCSSFGGPAAHLGYFYKEFVENRHWLTKESYAQFVMLSQVVPGPGSSQVGFAIGYHRGGWSGAVAAFVGFTLPSVIIMLLFVWGNNALDDNGFLQFWVQGLTLLATVVVADACYTMWKQFCKSTTTRIIAIASIAFLALWSFGYGTLIMLFITALVGGFLPLNDNKSASELTDVRYANTAGIVAVLLFVLSFFTFSSLAMNVFFDYYQAGSLVFGGGHVILPLLQSVLDQLPEEVILSGYALAQSVPGPMFTVATFLGGMTGREMSDPFAFILLGGMASLGVFLPGLLLMLFAQHHWKRFSAIPKINAAIVALNASVVGLLLFVFATVVLPHSVLSFVDGIVMVCTGAWLFWKRPSILVLLLVISSISWLRYWLA